MISPTMFLRAATKFLAAFSLLLGVACQHSIGQNRIIVSDPASEGPTVIQIQRRDGSPIVHQIRAPSHTEIFSPATNGLGVVQSVLPSPSNPSTATIPESATSGESSTARAAEAPAPVVAAVNASPSAATTRAPLKHSYNSVRTDQPIVAITFDDGPHPELTPKLLDILKKRNIRATFYVIGRNVDAYPGIAKRIVEEGHEIGNHSYTHPALSKLGAARVKSELDRTSEAIRVATGVRPATMRPPYGATNASLNRRINEEFSMPVIMWSVDPQDWRYRNASRVSSHIVANAKPGDIILAHDIHPSTIAAMETALDELLAKGLRFVTVSELLEYDSAPGAVAEMADASHAAGAPTPTN